MNDTIFDTRTDILIRCSVLTDKLAIFDLFEKNEQDQNKEVFSVLYCGLQKMVILPKMTASALKLYIELYQAGGNESLKSIKAIIEV
ncbi:hypothetical protein M5C72_05125 [Companilactobacillus allii]|uniref:Uncharacterized protein n=1 Tax=Companilactobacillus allii TaxID=1847728 RepID=A0A1P8Q3S0_9LACO|nr:hypothetical protein [Companilactobacillus allii]APX72500.1 hypothetical protein BTM29_08040 [Companilactobacillus allii]USQ69603.1 hypothetical protein M5C72_05125 [Companilactobacillus allii]